jgi:hypothetical protein
MNTASADDKIYYQTIINQLQQLAEFIQDDFNITQI